MRTVLKSKLGSRQQRQKKVLEVATGNPLRSGQGRSYTATEAKNEFGRVLEEALQGAIVVITRHDAPKAVLLSIDSFNALKQAPQVRLDTLSSEFDALLARMQTAQARAGMQRAFHASPNRLGKAALAAARKRG